MIYVSWVGAYSSFLGQGDGAFGNADLHSVTCSILCGKEEVRMSDRHRRHRWANFRRRAEYAPSDVYQHRIFGWEYIPVHPFGDEPEILERLGLRSEDCRSVDAMCGIDEDAFILQATVEGHTSGAPLFSALVSVEEDRWIYVNVLFAAPFVTRIEFEDAMHRIRIIGFLQDPSFRTKWKGKGVVHFK